MDKSSAEFFKITGTPFPGEIEPAEVRKNKKEKINPEMTPGEVNFIKTFGIEEYLKKFKNKNPRISPEKTKNTGK